MTPLTKGASFQVLKVNAKAGMVMPTHHATQEAVIVVQEGEALLKTPEGNHNFKPGTTFVLPAQMDHSLEIKKDFQAVVTMGLESKIKFQN